MGGVEPVGQAGSEREDDLRRPARRGFESGRVRDGDEASSPWPFRVYAETNVAREEYSSDVVGALMLFDELGRLGLGDVDAYARACATAFDWLMRVPIPRILAMASIQTRLMSLR